jgi:glycosyltransferase involved in cell wall biosynthesis
MSHLIVVSNAIERKVLGEGRVGISRSLIYNGVDLERYDHQEPCCTLRDEYGMDPDSPIVGVVGRLELEKGHPTLLEGWPLVLAAVPKAYLLIVGEGSSRRAQALVTGRHRASSCSPAGATTSRS